MVAEYFNLDFPPGVKGFDVEQPIDASRRMLPHLRQLGATYFVTIRLGDSLPRSTVERLQRMKTEWQLTHPEPRSDLQRRAFERVVQRRIDRWCDRGYGACWMAEQRWSDVVAEVLRETDDRGARIGCWSIMPNHLHLVMTPHPDRSLDQEMGTIKSISARRIRRGTATRGELWYREGYDRIIRSPEHLAQVVRYIGRNPSKAGLGHESEWRNHISPAWIEAGWRFF